MNLLLSLTKNGTLDTSRKSGHAASDLISLPAFIQLLENFISKLKEKRSSANTICSYKRIVSYFLIYCGEKEYRNLSDVKSGDISAFIMYLYDKGYFKPTTITSALSGFRQFLSMDDNTKCFLSELPSHLPRERKIIEIYDQDERNSIDKTLFQGVLSKRDTAICMMLIETGLRGVDICNLKLTDIDWNKDVIYIMQEKTDHPLRIPLRNSYGNVLADYILHERPQSNSRYVFLRSFAPFERLKGEGSSVRRILREMEAHAKAHKEGRISGSRMTRHNAASTMLRAGVPMSKISAVLGHRDPNVISVYLSTDDKALTGCTLPMPAVRRQGGLS
ncbi:MAG: tyrosine-type recombinase/integrase [Anaerocolumna sp.]